MGELQEFQKLVVANAKDVKGLNVGQIAPDFALPNATGKIVSLSETLLKGPVVLKFYRGEWCPICNLDLRNIQQILPSIKAKHATLMAISPQNPDDALTMREKNELGFEVLSDADQAVIKKYNLQFDPGEDYHNRRDLTLLNGDGSKTLPVPATFVIASDGKIITAHVEANYTERMEPEEILKALDNMSEWNDNKLPNKKQ